MASAGDSVSRRAASRRLHRWLAAVSSALLLLVTALPGIESVNLVGNPSVSAAGKVTRDQMIAEIKYAATIIKKNANYTKIAGFASTLLPKAPKKYDVTQVYNSTILLATNDALTALMKKVPITQLDKLFQVLQYATIRGRWNEAAFKKLGPVKFDTWLGKKIQKMSTANAAPVAFGVPGSAASKWTHIVTAKLYSGPYFTVHGIDYCIVV
ncbi:hypothetical protein CLOM_g8641 [Closterium sp. NIES-68]|nr:hypothetical protein CLOM_g8641 [Closterium sp. NIES-68]GJP67390.1 hypothetical protein CLOP_g24208 [Closterium sp. NIES-67]